MNLKPKYKEVILLFYYQDMKIKRDCARAGRAGIYGFCAAQACARAIEKEIEGWYADGK